MELTGNIDNDIINVFNTNERSTESNEFTIVAVIENEFKRSMNEIKSGAVYIDDVSIQVKKSANEYVIGAITHLVNHILTSQTLPLNWKKSIMVSLPKVTNPKRLRNQILSYHIKNF